MTTASLNHYGDNEGGRQEPSGLMNSERTGLEGMHTNQYDGAHDRVGYRKRIEKHG